MNEEPAARTRARLEKTKGRHRAKIEILNEILYTCVTYHMI